MRVLRVPAPLKDIHNDCGTDQHEETDDADEQEIEENPADDGDDTTRKGDDFAGPEFPEESVNFFFERV